MAIQMRAASLAAIYGKHKKIENFDWDGLLHPPIAAYLSQKDIDDLRYIATSPRLGGTSKKKKFKMMDNILNPKGFIRMTAGTNRVIYRCDFDQSFLFKVAIDDVGIRDSPAEYFNQQFLKPFFPKVFDVTPCGTVGMFERVEPILSRHEFSNVAGDIFDLLNRKILGKYVLEDIGTDFFKNWGLRENFGPVLLDFPYLYEVDGNKLVCTNVLPNGTVCGGLIDYDDGYNTLVCECCHKRYSARSLGKDNGAMSLSDKYNSERRNIKMAGKVGITRADGTTYGWSPNSPENDIVGDDVIKIRPSYGDGISIVYRQRKNKRNKNNRNEKQHFDHKPAKTVTAESPKKEKLIIVEGESAAPKKEECGCKKCECHKEESSYNTEHERVFTKEEMNDVANSFAEETLKEQKEVAAETDELIAEGKVGAAARVMIREFINDKAYEFLTKDTEGLTDEEAEKKANDDQKNRMLDYLITATLIEYPNINEKVVKQVVDDFVETGMGYNYNPEEVESETTEEEEDVPPTKEDDFEVHAVTAKDLY